MYKFLLIVILTWASLGKSAEFKSGEDYWQVRSGDSVAVAEGDNLFFTWWGCDSCRQIEEELSQQLEGFEVVPLIARQEWRPAAKAFYVMKMLEGNPNAEDVIKQRIEEGTLDPKDQKALFDAVIELGYDKEQVAELLEDRDLYGRIDQAVALAENYNIQYVPTVVVKGRFATDARHTMTVKKFGEVLEYLKTL
ncbi:DsbA family protein [Kangiella sediminilitoris]|uniref:DSBA-like thioredoxin domain-containing protein n=1 Tax=Kangiella sediminilitoris TaxID=1144748 RepID=A0A1B3B7V4_9GAMM|nr:thioredoxin domain-containing protein [Kangiella sediminilitoris]AOE48863.1 hypothetical protein KS2013_133 [Kangiella sediminilitoris]